jgi:hypothetical protein
MVPHPTLIIQVAPPTADGQIELVVTLPSGVVDRARLTLPFSLNQIDVLLRALNARQYPDYPERERLIKCVDDRAEIIDVLRALQLWDDVTGAVLMDIHMRVGQLLGVALLTDVAMQRSIQALHDAAIHADSGEIVWVFDERAMALAALPWELLHNRLQPLLLSNGVVLACTRVVDFQHAQRQPHEPGERLRVLTLAPRAQINEIGRTLEQRARSFIQNELQDAAVDIEPLPEVTLAALSDRLAKEPQVDILEYYGHGRFKNGSGALLLDPDPNLTLDESQQDWVSASRIATLRNLPPLIVLNACHSAQVDTGEPVAGIATALSAANVRAIVAMQLTTRMSAVTYGITPTLYRELAAGKSIQQAVAIVRQELYVREPDGASWYLPAVYLRQPDQQPYILIKRVVPPPNPFDGRGALDDSAKFVGRQGQRQRLWQRLRIGGNVSIVGGRYSGKTALLALIEAEARQQLGEQIQVVRLMVQRRMTLNEAKRDLARLLGIRKASDLMLKLENSHLILLLDNLGQMDTRNGDELTVRQWLRELSQDRTRATIQLVATSTRRLDQIFVQDESPDFSPLHNVLTDVIEFGPFSDAEVRSFISSRLVSTPFLLNQFADLLREQWLPGKLEEACCRRYDELCI